MRSSVATDTSPSSTKVAAATGAFFSHARARLIAVLPAGVTWAIGLPGLLVEFLAHAALEAGDVQDPYVLLLNADEAFILELREGAADGLELEPEVAADFLARHAQVEFGRRVAARHETLRHVEQERGQPLLGAHRAEQQHDAVLPHDLAAHHLVELLLQQEHFAPERFEARIRDDAYLAVIQRHGAA